MPEARLPTGFVVSCQQKHDVGIVNVEVQTYFENGIMVRPGDTIIDVGANIGLFALAAQSRAPGQVRVYCIEPVPAMFSILEENLRRLNDPLLFAHNFGFSNKAGIVDFAYYPDAPVLSTAYPDAAADHEEVKQATLTNIINMPEAPAQLKLLKLFPPAMREWILDKALRKTLQYEMIRCELTTLSAFISEQGIDQIDLLKIDAEKSELDILQGIDKNDWPRIRQVVVDVHDIDNRLDKVLALLFDNGLKRITIEQPPTLIGSSIYTLLAVRPSD